VARFVHWFQSKNATSCAPTWLALKRALVWIWRRRGGCGCCGGGSWHQRPACYVGNPTEEGSICQWTFIHQLGNFCSHGQATLAFCKFLCDIHRAYARKYDARVGGGGGHATTGTRVTMRGHRLIVDAYPFNSFFACLVIKVSWVHSKGHLTLSFCDWRFVDVDFASG